MPPAMLSVNDRYVDKDCNKKEHHIQPDESGDPQPKVGAWRELFRFEICQYFPDGNAQDQGQGANLCPQQSPGVQGQKEGREESCPKSDQGGIGYQKFDYFLHDHEVDHQAERGDALDRQADDGFGNAKQMKKTEVYDPQQIVIFFDTWPAGIPNQPISVYEILCITHCAHDVIEQAKVACSVNNETRAPNECGSVETIQNEQDCKHQTVSICRKSL